MNYQEQEYDHIVSSCYPSGKTKNIKDLRKKNDKEYKKFMNSLEKIKPIQYPIKFKITLGKTSERRWFNVEIEINEKFEQRTSINHHIIRSYKTLSICGEARDISDGQNYDDINDEVIKDWFIRKDRAQRLVEIWKRWHLNDMHAGCIHQTYFNCNENWEEQSKRETEKCPSGYAYGSAWLVEDLPQEIIDELLTFRQEL